MSGTKQQRHPLLEKQIKRAARFSEDGSFDIEVLFDNISETYFEQDSLRERHDRASKLMADEILESKKLLDLIVARNPGGIFWKNRERSFIGCNEFVLRLFGLESMDRIIGKTNAELDLPESYTRQYEREESWVLENGKPKLDSVYAIKVPNSDHETYIAISTIPLFDNQGQVLGILGVLRDITEQTLYERALENAKEEADKANQAKSEFLANMSHELRTPLNSILGLTRILIEDLAMDTENREMAEIVHKSATALLAIVNDILDISKIESGGMELEHIGFDPRELISTAIEFLAPVASSKGISLHYSYEKSGMPYLVGDSFRVGRILINLLGNAVKYTEKGQVSVRVDYTPLDKGRIALYCEVSDTGTGIPEARLADIFEKFVQADVSTTRKFGGTGLGLAITRELVEMMNGEIGVESKVGKGSTFWFRIPFDTTDDIQTPLREKARAKLATGTQKSGMPLVKAEDARILVAEDHQMNQEFIIRILSRMGIGHVDIRDNGLLAYRAYTRNEYDLVLMDCHMPEQNGYETTRKIRDREKGQGRHIPVIALTADAMKGTREKCTEAGMDDYITKPIDAQELQQVLSNWIVFGNPASRGARKQARQKTQKAIVLELLEKYATTPDDLAHLIGLFKDEGAKSIALLGKYCVAGNSPEWVDAAHKLKGGAGMVGAKDLHELCRQAQLMADVPAKDRKAILTKIRKEHERVCVHMDKMIEKARGE